MTISSMKSLVSPTLTFLCPSNLAEPCTFSSPLYFLRNLNILFRFRPSFFSFMKSVRFNSVWCYTSQNHAFATSSPAGDTRVIVQPMFASRSSTLMHRIQSESRNGSFQAAPIERSSLLLDQTLKDLCYSGRLREAMALLSGTEVVVEWQTYALLLQECIHRRAYTWGKRVHAHMVVVGLALNEYLKTKLLILYAKAGELETAYILFDKVLQKSLISWNAMIAGYVQKGLGNIGLGLYFKMRWYGLTPDQFTFASVFRACATLALLEQGKQAHGVMVKCGIKQNVVVNSALMDMYFKSSSPNDGHQVFSKSPDKNVITWTALISGYGQNGRVAEVLELFDKMNEEGLRPNYVTFLAVLSACSHGGLVDEGWKYFISMKKEHGIQPCGKHYATMVDLLGRAGRLEEAFKYVSSSPCKENSVVWGSLLGACRMHGDFELLKLSAKKFFKLEPENAGKYVVLSNSYATYGLWENVAQVRGLMRDFGVKKDPAYSRIEVQNEVHFFFKGDNTHKDAENTHRILKELTGVLVDNGYVPDLTLE